MKAHPCALVGVVLLPLVVCGCPGRPERFVSLETLVAEHNANARRVPRLWARARMRLSFSDEKGRKFSWGSAAALAPSNGYVMLWKEPPASAGSPEKLNFALIGREVGMEMFRVGADAQMGLYYLWYSYGNEGQAWYGRQQFAGAPDVVRMPIDPLQLVEVLGVTALPEPRASAMPAVVMTLETDPYAYVVRYLRPQPVTGHLKIWREVYFRWDDKRPRRPFRVKLFDADGLCRVIADVGQYAPVASDRQGEPPAIMPTDIRMSWPAIKNMQPASSIHIRLSEMSTTRDFSKDVFDFLSKLPAGLSDPIQVDGAYGLMGIESGSP